MNKSCQCVRTKKRSAEEEKALLNRLNRIQGQIRGLIKMVEEDAYCPDIINQAGAAKEAINAFSRCLLEEHLRTCVCRDLQMGKLETAEEVTQTIRRMMK